MKLQTWLVLVLIILAGWLGYDKITGTTTDLTPYINQIAEMSKTVADLQLSCKK